MKWLAVLSLTLLLTGCTVSVPIAVPLCVPPEARDYEPVCRGTECVTEFEWGST